MGCRLRDWSLSEALRAVLEGVGLVSRQFRKRRLALWAAGRGPDPHFTAMYFGSARPVFERSFTGSAGRCETSFQAVQKATFGTMGCRPQALSVLHCHGVLALRDRSLSEALLAVLEGVRLVSRQFRKRRLALTSLPWCFGPARPVFERSFTGSAGRCETSF